MKDRIVQAGLLVVLQPVFEADFDDGSFGSRPKRGAHGALDAIRNALCQGQTGVIDPDLNGYSATIDHACLSAESRTMNDPGKPDAGDPPVWIDEGRAVQAGNRYDRLPPLPSTGWIAGGRRRSPVG